MPSRDIVEAFAKRLENGDSSERSSSTTRPMPPPTRTTPRPMVGRDKLAAKERGVLAAFKEVKAVRIGPSLIEGDTSRRVGGSASPMPKALRGHWKRSPGRHWRGDQFIEERFYYDPKQMGR